MCVCVCVCVEGCSVREFGGMRCLEVTIVKNKFGGGCGAAQSRDVVCAASSANAARIFPSYSGSLMNLLLPVPPAHPLHFPPLMVRPADFSAAHNCQRSWRSPTEKPPFLFAHNF